jgi:hypothetical protein
MLSGALGIAREDLTVLYMNCARRNIFTQVSMRGQLNIYDAH